MKIKIIFCLFFNIIFFSISLDGYLKQKKLDNLKKIEKPIDCYVYDIKRFAKSTPLCSVNYNGNSYKFIDISGEDNYLVKKGYNNKDFYYDNIDDKIFYGGDSNNVLLILFILFLVSLLLWFIPKNKFK